MQNIFTILLSIGSIAVCLGLVLIGFQFLCMVVSLVAVAVYGLVGTIVKFLTTKH